MWFAINWVELCIATSLGSDNSHKNSSFHKPNYSIIIFETFDFNEKLYDLVLQHCIITVQVFVYDHHVSSTTELYHVR